MIWLKVNIAGLCTTDVLARYSSMVEEVIPIIDMCDLIPALYAARAPATSPKRNFTSASIKRISAFVSNRPLPPLSVYQVPVEMMRTFELGVCGFFRSCTYTESAFDILLVVALYE